MQQKDIIANMMYDDDVFIALPYILKELEIPRGM